MDRFVNTRTRALTRTQSRSKGSERESGCVRALATDRDVVFGWCEQQHMC